PPPSPRLSRSPSRQHRDPHSFPTRRSSDLSQHELIAEAEGATDDWTPYLRRTVIRALAMANGIKAADIPPEWATIQPRWRDPRLDRKSTRLNSSHVKISYAVFCLKKKIHDM